MAINCPFKESESATLGVEVELQLVDSRTMVPTSLVGTEQLAGNEYSGCFKPELFRSMVEIVSPMLHHVEQVGAFLSDIFRSVQEHLEPLGLTALAAGTHPFLNHRDAVIVNDPRYHAFLDELQVVLRRFIICGMHIHSNVRNGEMAVKASNLAAEYLAVFLALTASSPFFEGENTGLKSYRSIIFGSLPRAGLPGYFENYAKYEELITVLHRCELISSYNDVWWDVRIRPDLGTIELRACDAVNDTLRIQAVAALFQALCHAADRFKSGYLSGQVNSQNKWAAVRHGLDGPFVSAGGRRTIRETGLKLLADLEALGIFTELGTERSIPRIRRFLEQACPARRMLEIHAQTQSLSDVAAYSRIGC
ncbi:MAG: hypothetical protein C0622_09310 [Desulfuromonas sp.]|nr:MAG: hypothetical protein C0622_09310 [Desulfuromonas sp.]